MDISTIWDVGLGQGDYQVANGTLVSGNDIESAMLISLFTDRAAGPDDVLPDATQNKMPDPRGWWADTDEAYPIGSRLWLLDRSKGPADLPARAKGYAQEALQWMVDDSIVGRFDINAAWKAPNQLRMIIIAYSNTDAVIGNVSRDLW
jgi:phage gp46-like protein